MKKLANIKTAPQYRDLTVTRDAVNIDARTVELAFSSQEPVQRWYGLEILDHSPGCIRLDRLLNGGAVLDNHDPDEQIGVVDSVSIGQDMVGRAQCRFSRAAEADEIFQDICDGIRRHISVGYIVHQYVEEVTKNADGTETTICRITDWEPIEISVVAIPADPTVGVGRSLGGEEAKPQHEAPDPTPIVITETRSAKMSEHEHETARLAGVAAEQKRAADLLAMAETYAQHGAREMVADFIRSGKTPEQFTKAILEKIDTKHSDAREIALGMSEREKKQYSLARAILAAASQDWSKAGYEREISQACAKRYGKDPEGFFMPVDMYDVRGFSAGTAAEAGSLIQTSVLGSEFIDVLRNKLVLNALGIRVLGGLTSNVAIPRKTAGTTVASYTEIQSISQSNPATDQVSLTPRRIGAQVPYSKQALIQGSVDVEAMLRGDLADGVAVQIENLCINGTASGGQPRGLVNQSGIGSVVGGTTGAQIAWSHIVGLESACANANSEPDQRAGYLVNTKTRGWLKQTQKATYLDYIWDKDPKFPLNGYRAGVTNYMVSNGTKSTGTNLSTLAFGSDWSDFVLALFGGLDIVVDPFTQAGTGQLVITANQFIDVGLRHAASFAIMTDGATQ